jgi:hypothetical protein
MRSWLGFFVLSPGRKGKKMQKNSDLHIRIEKDLVEWFRKFALETGVTQSEYLRAFILELVRGQYSKAVDNEKPVN